MSAGMITEQKKNNTTCPKCKSSKIVFDIETTGTGVLGHCQQCRHTGPLAKFYDEYFRSIQNYEYKWMKEHGMTPAQITEAERAFEKFLRQDEKITPRKTWWRTPLGKKAFIMGWHYRQVL